MSSDKKRERSPLTKSNENLSGFEELLDKVPQSRIFEDDLATDQYYLTNFLFQETERLEALDSFIGEKLPLIEQYPETNYHIRQQQQLNKEIKEEIISQMISIESTVHGYMELIWTQG
ncbi:MAG: hypothetical protein HN353_12240 [Bdellovibrionales bacterium]|jgi:hypothetical protein|nr:hypothetical protein [Bdellovibrionales bacterium]MBT3526134.1 hypothetical protein [Bdellovibrionales bacterium]MBT7668727.1 hypothetical protein [Bdellovibrionales bacterium]MBT7766875.1 hypothetical protein [Bdellovibrionales bacterium]